MHTVYISKVEITLNKKERELLFTLSLLLPQGGWAFGQSCEKIHPDPAEINHQRVEVGKDRLRRHRGLCPLLVTVCLCHPHFLVWVGAFLLIKNAFGGLCQDMFCLCQVCRHFRWNWQESYVELKRISSQGIAATCAFSYITLRPNISSLLI